MYNVNAGFTTQVDFFLARNCEPCDAATFHPIKKKCSTIPHNSAQRSSDCKPYICPTLAQSSVAPPAKYKAAPPAPTIYSLPGFTDYTV